MPTEPIERCCKCCTRVPSSSLLALMMLICGLGLLTGSLITVGERLKKNEILYYNDFYEIFKVIILGLALGMLLIGILFLIISILLSGKTRRMLFWGNSRHICAKVLNSIVFTLCYLLFIIWFLITCSLLYPLFLNAYYKFFDCKKTTTTLITSNLSLNAKKIITNDTDDNILIDNILNDNNNCIDARLLRLRSGIGINGTNKVCGERKYSLCNNLDEYLISFGIAFIGSFVIMLSLIHFIISMSSNHAYIKSDSPEYIQELNVNGNVNDAGLVEETKM